VWSGEAELNRFDNQQSCGLLIGRHRLKACGGPEGPLNVARGDGRVADATRAGDILFTRSIP